MIHRLYPGRKRGLLVPNNQKQNVACVPLSSDGQSDIAWLCHSGTDTALQLLANTDSPCLYYTVTFG